MIDCLDKPPSTKPTVPSATTATAFKAEVRAWAERIGVHPTTVHVRPMSRKWASCSAGGRLTFDLGLLTQPADFRTEAIVHELLHLRIPNHGRLFRSMLLAYLAAGAAEAIEGAASDGNPIAPFIDALTVKDDPDHEVRDAGTVPPTIKEME